MVLDRGLSDQAKANAQKIANMGQLMHLSQPERDDARENLAYACSSNGVPLTGEAATKMWYIPPSQLYFFAQIINATDC